MDVRINACSLVHCQLSWFAVYHHNTRIQDECKFHAYSQSRGPVLSVRAKIGCPSLRLFNQTVGLSQREGLAHLPVLCEEGGRLIWDASAQAAARVRDVQSALEGAHELQQQPRTALVRSLIIYKCGSLLSAAG